MRQVLYRHLPESVLIGTGFVVNAFGPSTEVDVLVVDRDMPTLFKEGELLIVTPEAVRAVIEVKTRLKGQTEICSAVTKLAKQKAHVLRHHGCERVWAGLFIFEGDDDRHQEILIALNEARAAHQCCVDCVAYASDTFVKLFLVSEELGGRDPAPAWHSFHDQGLAPASFVAGLIEALTPAKRDMGAFAWFSRPSGLEKRYFMLASPNGRPTRFEG